MKPIIIVLACLLSAGCASKHATISAYPTLDEVKLVENTSNAELLGEVQGVARSHYGGCKGLPEEAYQQAGNAARILGANAISRVEATTKFSFWVYYWGCNATVNAGAFIVPE